MPFSRRKWKFCMWHISTMIKWWERRIADERREEIIRKTLSIVSTWHVDRNTFASIQLMRNAFFPLSEHFPRASILVRLYSKHIVLEVTSKLNMSIFEGLPSLHLQMKLHRSTFLYCSSSHNMLFSLCKFFWELTISQFAYISHPAMVHTYTYLQNRWLRVSGPNVFVGYIK